MILTSKCHPNLAANFTKKAFCLLKILWYLFDMPRLFCFLISALLLPPELIVAQVAGTEQVSSRPDSTMAVSISLASFSARATAIDSLNLRAGDSIFVYDGDLYFRARINGQDFFISRKDLLARSDSLVVYQNYRLTAGFQTLTSPDTTVRKIERQRCTMITKNGTRCKRLAVPGSDRCWQHKR